jgi:hypothetical protein
MESTDNTLSSEDRSALCQLEQKASNLRQSSSNNFLVALEGLMLSAIAWESIGKPKAWISNLSKATTAIGLGITAIFTSIAVRDRAKASKIDGKLARYGVDDMTLPCEMQHAEPVHSAFNHEQHHHTAQHHHHMAHAGPHHGPHTTVLPEGREVSHMREASAEHAV